MGTVIYSTSPLGAFLGTFLTTAFLLVIGVVGLAWAIFNRKQGKGARIAAGCAGLFLCGIGALTVGYTLLSMFTGTKTATVLVNQKTVAHDNCGDNGQTCDRYVLETSAPPKSYDFTVEKRAFDDVREGGCYEISYFPNTGLFATDYGTDLYVASGHVSRIVQADASACKP
jgi:hypothetical protein